MLACDEIRRGREVYGMGWAYQAARAAVAVLKPRLAADLGLRNAVAIRVSSEMTTGEKGGMLLGTCCANGIVLYTKRIWRIAGGNKTEFVRRVYNTLAHEFRHAWQSETGILRTPDLPYMERPREQDARAYAAAVYERIPLDVGLVMRRADALRCAAMVAKRRASSRGKLYCYPLAGHVMATRRSLSSKWRAWRGRWAGDGPDCGGAMPGTPGPQRRPKPQGVPP